MSCGCPISQKERDKEHYKKIAATIPLIKGSIIRPDGTVLDIADVIGVPKTPIDPQLAKAQNIFPYIRDTVILENGQTCSLVQMVEHFLSEFEKMEGLDEKWTAYLNELKEMLVQLREYINEVEEQAGLVYTEELRLTPCELSESDWLPDSQTIVD